MEQKPLPNLFSLLQNTLHEGFIFAIVLACVVGIHREDRGKRISSFPFSFPFKCMPRSCRRNQVAVTGLLLAFYHD